MGYKRFGLQSLARRSFQHTQLPVVFRVFLHPHRSPITPPCPASTRVLVSIFSFPGLPACHPLSSCLVVFFVLEYESTLSIACQPSANGTGTRRVTPESRSSHLVGPGTPGQVSPTIWRAPVVTTRMEGGKDDAMMTTNYAQKD